MNPKTTRCLLSHTLLLLGATSLPTLAQEAAKELPTVSVQADADKPDGYRATTTRVGKVLQDPHDIPQAVTTITNTLMEEQQVGSLKEALRNVSGLSFNAAEGGRSGDNMNLRGFYTFGDMYLDGIRDTAQYNRETFNYEQIDVLRGAGAMLFGRGQAGGVINQVSKTPLRIEQYKLTGSVGDYGYREVTADINKPIDGSTALRINAMQRDEGSWRSNPASGSEPEIHRKGLAFSLGPQPAHGQPVLVQPLHPRHQRQPRLRHLLRRRHQAAGYQLPLLAGYLLGRRP
jgi:catecholate siderophore receptor